jgi:RNA polymerase sigma-70 factor (sigma-E family)
VEFEEYAATRLPALLRYAAALTADPVLAQDVVQDVLVKVCLRWERVARAERPDDYVRRMVLNEYLSWRRRWQVRSVRSAPDAVLHAHELPLADHAAGVADRDEVRRQLARLRPRQRAMVVLRYFEDLDDATIAARLGISTSTVRSTLSRTLAFLRTGPLDTREEARS